MSGVSKIRLISSLEGDRIQVQMPEERFLREVEASALELGEASALSDADKELLALALQLKPVGQVELVSDDYSVQNMAEALGIGYRGLTTRGIQQRFKWLLYCPGCHRVFDRPPIDGLCPHCGSEIKRKPVETHPLRRGRKTP